MDHHRAGNLGRQSTGVHGAGSQGGKSTCANFMVTWLRVFWVLLKQRIRQRGLLLPAIAEAEQQPEGRTNR